MTTAAPPSGTVVFLHGHDDDPAAARDLIGATVGPTWQVVTPAGPVVTGDGRHAWWRSDDDGAPITVDVVEAIALVDGVLAGLDPATPILLGGFSQGGALALALALRARLDDSAEPGAAPGDVLAGVFAVSAWMPDLAELPADIDGAAPRGTPVLIAHGADDDDVPLLLGRGAARLLDRRGVPVRFVELEVGHQLAPFVPTVTDWIAAVARGELPTDPP